MARTAKALQKKTEPIAKPASKTARPASKKHTQKKATGVQDAYDAIAKDWDDSRKRPFSPMPLFVEEFQRRFSKRTGTLTHARILDAGCGNARNTIWLSKKLPRACICCCDNSAGMLRSASRNVAAACKAHSCVITKADIGNTRHPSARFDAVLCTAVLHHIPSAQGRVRALTEIGRVLKPSGFAFVTVWSDPQATPGTDKDVEFPTGRGGKIKRYYHFFSMRELTGDARKAGLEVSDAFYEAGGRRTDAQDGSKARNLCAVLQKPGRRPAVCKG